MKQIKPCPFCGSENVKYSSLAGRVFCKDCQARGPCGATDKDAIKKWNAAPRKKDMKMEKCCQNCVHISKEVDGKVYCIEELDEDYSCKYWAQATPFESDPRLCWSCKYNYVDDECAMYCGREIGNPKGYVCDKWDGDEDEKESISPPLNPSNSSGLKTLCEKAISKWGEAAQINKAIEELLELEIALTRYQNLNLRDEDYQEKAYKILDNIHEEREDVEIMLRQLDVIFGRSTKWQRKKYEHLRQIVGDAEDG